MSIQQTSKFLHGASGPLGVVSNPIARPIAPKQNYLLELKQREWASLTQDYVTANQTKLSNPIQETKKGIVSLNGEATSIPAEAFAKQNPAAQELIAKLPNSEFARDALSRV